MEPQQQQQQMEIEKSAFEVMGAMSEKVNQLMNDAKESQRILDKQDQELTSILLDAYEKEQRIGRELESQINKIIAEVQQRIIQIQSQFGTIGIQMK